MRCCAPIGGDPAPGLVAWAREFFGDAVPPGTRKPCSGPRVPRVTRLAASWSYGLSPCSCRVWLTRSWSRPAILKLRRVCRRRAARLGYALPRSLTDGRHREPPMCKPQGRAELGRDLPSGPLASGFIIPFGSLLGPLINRLADQARRDAAPGWAMHGRVAQLQITDIPASRRSSAGCWCSIPIGFVLLA